MMIASLIITLILIFAGGITLMTLIDVTESDVLHIIFIAMYGLLSIYLMVHWFFEYLVSHV